MKKNRVVYVIGAGLSAGLGFPTVEDLLWKLWPRIELEDLSDRLAAVIRFHHPSFNPSRADTFPNIEQLLSEMQANTQLFSSSRPVAGRFTLEDLDACRRHLLLQIAYWFHEIQGAALRKPPDWLLTLVEAMKEEKSCAISFNWDLVLDQLLFENNLNKSCYFFDKAHDGVSLIKPHGSLNWYEKSTGKTLKGEKRFGLYGAGDHEILAFKPYRAPVSKKKKREYMPLIVPPVYAKQFGNKIFEKLWQQTVSVLSTATEVRFLGYSLPTADFHARFIMRCGFHNQEHGELKMDGTRAPVCGRAKVVIVNPQQEAANRISDAVGWNCEIHKKKIEEWVSSK